jgi:hypothetical protein
MTSSRFLTDGRKVKILRWGADVQTMTRLWPAAIVALLLSTGCAASSPTVSAGPSDQTTVAQPTTDVAPDPSTTDPSTTDPGATPSTTDPGATPSTTDPGATPEFTIVTQPPPEGFPDLGPISVDDYPDAPLNNLADIIPDQPFDSLTLVAVQVSNYDADASPKDFRIETSIGEPCKTAGTESCKRNFARATSTQPEKWFAEYCGNCAEYTARFLVVTNSDGVRAGLSDLSFFGPIDTPTEVAWTYVAKGFGPPRVRSTNGALEVLASFTLDECEPHITRMVVSRMEPDGTLVPIRYNDVWPDPNTGPACP